METRTVELIELHAADQTNPRRLTGRAIVYNQDADLGPFVERIKPGALNKALKTEPNIMALYEHDRRGILGSTRNHTLRLSDTDQGLNFELDVADTSSGNDVLSLVKAGELRGMSFGFIPARNGATWTRSGNRIIRTITDIERLPEITVTADPAYEATNVQARSIDPATLEQARRIAATPTQAEHRLRLRRLALAVQPIH